MNKIIVFVSFVISILLMNLGVSTKSELNNIRQEDFRLEAKNEDMEKKINDKEYLTKGEPVLLSKEYGLVMNQARILEGYSGTNMNIELEADKDTVDITDHFVETEYKGVKGLKIKIVVDKFSKETDMGAVLDDIHLLEKNTDFMASEIVKENNNVIVKGEIYGI